MTKELLQQALDALTRLSFLGNGDFPGNSEGNRIAQKTVSDIKQALAQQEQPAQKVSESWTDIVAVNLVREGVNKHKARELAAHFLTLFAPHTQPALSEAEVLEIARKWSNRRFAESSQRFLLDFARELIESHCRGGATS